MNPQTPPSILPEFHVTQAEQISCIDRPTMMQRETYKPESDMRAYAQLTSPFPAYCRMFYSTPQHFPANLNASCTSSSGFSSLDLSSSDDEHLRKSQTPDSLISSTTDEEILDVVNYDSHETQSVNDDRHAQFNEIPSTLYRLDPDFDKRTSMSPCNLSDCHSNLSNSFCPIPDFDSKSSPPTRIRPEAARNLSDDFRLCAETTEKPVTTVSPKSQENGNKKPRTNFGKHQIDAMNTEFTDNPYPDSERIEEMSRELCIPESKIKVWFQNKRARFRRKVPQVQPVSYPTPVYVPAIPHHVMTTQGVVTTRTGHVLPTQYPLMIPAMYTSPFVPQPILRHPYYAFPDYHIGSNISSSLINYNRLPMQYVHQNCRP